MEQTSTKRASREEIEIELQNDDLHMEVLSRMPAKSVLELKCVSPEWLHFISNASFRQLHSQRTRPVVSGFFFQETFQWCNDDIESVSYIPIESARGGVRYGVLDFLPEKVVIMASSSGFICCRSCKSSLDPVIYICNPTCKEYVPVKWSETNRAQSIALAFDSFSYSKGVSTDFKLVSVHKSETYMEYNIEETHMDVQYSFEIYSSKTGKWRSAIDTCLCNFNLFRNKGVFAGGVLYWLTDADKILAFDVENEKSCIIDVPLDIQCKCIPEMCIGESEGHLHYIHASEVGLQDWVLKDYEPHWSLEHFIPLAALEEEYPQFFYNVRKRVASSLTAGMPYFVPLAYKDGFLLMSTGSKIFSNNFYTRKMEEHCSLDCLGPNSVGAPMVLPYTLTLLPLELNAAVLVLS